jgi:uncharacterized protein (UPF0147 family)
MIFDTEPEHWPLHHDFRSLLHLWSEVFITAINDVKRDIRRKGAESTQALAWLNNDTNVGIGSFISLCELFNHDPDRVRKNILISAQNPRNYKSKVHK